MLKSLGEHYWETCYEYRLKTSQHMRITDYLSITRASPAVQMVKNPPDQLEKEIS